MNSASLKLVLLRRKAEKSAPTRFVLSNVAPVRSAPRKSAPASLTPLKVAHRRSRLLKLKTLSPPSDDSSSFSGIEVRTRCLRKGNVSRNLLLASQDLGCPSIRA